MKNNRPSHVAVLSICAVAMSCFLGCEGIGRRHDPQVLDISNPPEEDASPDFAQRELESANFPDLVERMLANRETLLSVREHYFDQLREMERAYLQVGDTVKANWARRQRQRLEEADVEPYPYLTAVPPEHRVGVAPEVLSAEADEIYDRALALLDEVRGIPFMGHLPHNKRKVREALELFKDVLRDYPKSDKVDDCAFYCGEIYKEYLRSDDPDNELAIRYYKWAFALDPQTPHAARFQCAVVYDFRRVDRVRALELYNQVLDVEEDANMSNQRFAATRIRQLTDDEFSQFRPRVATADETPSVDTADWGGPADDPVTANFPDDETDASDPDITP